MTSTEQQLTTEFQTLTGLTVPEHDRLEWLLQKLPASEIKTPLVKGDSYFALGSANGVGHVYVRAGNTALEAALKLALAKEGKLEQ